MLGLLSMLIVILVVDIYCLCFISCNFVSSDFYFRFVFLFAFAAGIETSN